MKNLLLVGAGAVLLSGCLSDSDDNDNPMTPVEPPSFAATETFNVMLSGKQQVPMNSSMQMAMATVEYDENLMKLRASVDLSGVEGVQAAHIHDGDLGMNGDVAFMFEDTDGDGTFDVAETDITEDLVADLRDGDWYINVHTDMYPDGEIRGQIVNDTTVITTFMLSGKQEVPMVDTDASGYVYAAVDTSDYEVNLVAHTMGVDDATMAHIHTGRIGMNGDVLVALEQSAEDMGVWMVPEDTMIDEDTFAVLASGGHYVNIHTPAYPGGELRGQILTDNFVLATFPLDGEQEVPAYSTMASGEGYALVNTTDYSVELVVNTTGVEDATMAHIHTGRIGMNGDVLVALEQSMDNMGTWMTPADTMINADILAVLASGGHYVNIHTPASPSGEIRGQILTDDYVMATFPLGGDQEVPAVTTDAYGDGYALVNTKTFALELQAVTMGVEDATMAHIHTGYRGENGDVLVALEQDANDVNRWMTPAELTITSDILTILLDGGHYVNIHTPAFPSGEIRGQIE